MTVIDLAALISTALILLAIGGTIAERGIAESRANRRRMARRVK